MSDLVERLRRGEPCREGCGAPCRTMDAASGCICAEAADRIERLEAEGDKARARGDRMRMALEDIAYGNPLHNEDDLMRIARAALEECT